MPRGRGWIMFCLILSFFIGASSTTAIMMNDNTREPHTVITKTLFVNRDAELKKERIRKNRKAVKESVNETSQLLDTKKKFEVYARRVCLDTIPTTLHEECYSTKILFKTLPKDILGTVENYSRNGVYVDQVMTYSPLLIGKTKDEVKFTIAHEWNHVQITLTVKTFKREKQAAKRARAYYYNVDGTEKTDSEALEVLTDCMTLNEDGLSWWGYYPPYYLDSTRAPGNPKIRYQRMCHSWSFVLYGR